MTDKKEVMMIDGFVIWQGVFGGWGWERYDRDGRLLDESHCEFETREECVEDAGARAQSLTG
jgi:hypothetical protein